MLKTESIGFFLPNGALRIAGRRDGSSSRDCGDAAVQYQRLRLTSYKPPQQGTWGGGSDFIEASRANLVSVTAQHSGESSAGWGCRTDTTLAPSSFGRLGPGPEIAGCADYRPNRRPENFTARHWSLWQQTEDRDGLVCVPHVPLSR